MFFKVSSWKFFEIQLPGESTRKPGESTTILGQVYPEKIATRTWCEKTRSWREKPRIWCEKKVRENPEMELVFSEIHDFLDVWF